MSNPGGLPLVDVLSDRHSRVGRGISRLQGRSLKRAETKRVKKRMWGRTRRYSIQTSNHVPSVRCRNSHFGTRTYGRSGLGTGARERVNNVADRNGETAHLDLLNPRVRSTAAREEEGKKETKSTKPKGFHSSARTAVRYVAKRYTIDCAGRRSHAD